MLTVLEKVATPKHIKNQWVSYFKCRCDCGNETVVAGSALRETKEGGGIVSCGCFRVEACKERERKKNHPTHGIVLTYYKRNAKVRGLTWELSADAFTTMVHSDCYYCGAKPQVRTIIGKKLSYNGVDRVDNTIGYTEANCVPCCSACNTAKSSRPLAEFKTVRKILCQKQCSLATCILAMPTPTCSAAALGLRWRR